MKNVLDFGKSWICVLSLTAVSMLMLVAGAAAQVGSTGDTASSAADADRRQTLNAYQTKIDDLKSQIDRLQDSVDQNLEDAQRFDQNADQWEQTCASIRGYCMYAMYIVNSRATAETARQNARNDKAQIRELQSQVRELERKINELQGQ
jgi:TolA-binding protein